MTIGDVVSVSDVSSRDLPTSRLGQLGERLGLEAEHLGLGLGLSYIVARSRAHGRFLLASAATEEDAHYRITIFVSAHHSP